MLINLPVFPDDILIGTQKYDNCVCVFGPYWVDIKLILFGEL